MEYISSFVEAGDQILSTMAQIQCRFKDPYGTQEPMKAGNVIIMVGMTGELKGHAILSMDEEIAMNIASKMMMGMPVESLDEMAKSALSELANMVMGTAAVKLEGKGIVVDITPPSLMTGENLSISGQAVSTMCIPIETDCGDMSFNIAVKKQ